MARSRVSASGAAMNDRSISIRFRSPRSASAAIASNFTSRNRLWTSRSRRGTSATWPMRPRSRVAQKRTSWRSYSVSVRTASSPSSDPSRWSASAARRATRASGSSSLSFSRPAALASPIRPRSQTALRRWATSADARASRRPDMPEPSPARASEKAAASRTAGSPSCPFCWKSEASSGRRIEPRTVTASIRTRGSGDSASGRTSPTGGGRSASR